jgi:hypothetical protein
MPPGDIVTIILSVIMASVIMASVILFNVAASWKTLVLNRNGRHTQMSKIINLEIK